MESPLDMPRRTLKVYTPRSVRPWKDKEVFSALILYNFMNI